MARTNKKGELFSHLTQFGIFRDATSSPGSSTLSGAEAEGQTVLSLVSSTNFAAGDYSRVGADEDVEIIQQEGAPAGNDITSRWALGRDHASGEAVVEQTLTDLGHITDEGVRWAIEGDGEVIKSAIRRLELGLMAGHVGIRFEVDLEGYALENIATMLGMNESRVGGSGTAASPTTLFVGGEKIRENNSQSFMATGLLKDGRTCRALFMGVELDINGLESQLRRGGLSTLRIAGRAYSGTRWLLNT